MADCSRVALPRIGGGFKGRSDHDRTDRLEARIRIAESERGIPRPSLGAGQAANVTGQNVNLDGRNEEREWPRSGPNETQAEILDDTATEQPAE
jgi:hypothetical protein